MSTPVLEVLPAAQRKRAYLIYSLVSIAVTGVLAGFASIGSIAPDLVIFLSAFVNVAGAGFGFVASANVSRPAVTGRHSG